MLLYLGVTDLARYGDTFSCVYVMHVMYEESPLKHDPV